MNDTPTRENFQIDFMSLVELERSQGRPDWALISITDSDQSPAVIPAAYRHFLRMSFDDLDNDAIEHGSIGVTFSQSDAQIIWDFIRRIANTQELVGLAIQCEAGRSRSAAIALFASAVTQGHFVSCRRIDGFNDLVLGRLEAASGVRVFRPRITMVEPGQTIPRAIAKP